MPTCSTSHGVVVHSRHHLTVSGAPTITSPTIGPPLQRQFVRHRPQHVANTSPSNVAASQNFTKSKPCLSPQGPTAQRHVELWMNIYGVGSGRLAADFRSVITACSRHLLFGILFLFARSFYLNPIDFQSTARSATVDTARFTPPNFSSCASEKSFRPG